MKKFILLIVVSLFGIVAKAQNAELNKLTDIVSSLRTGGEKAYKEAIARLAKDKEWTPMDELGINKEAECKTSERPKGFKLNAVLTNAENAERYQTTTGNHLNGADSRYSYSLFEKTIKGGKSATYLLNERWGEQTFIVIPYSGNVSVVITSDNHKFQTTPIGNGAVKITGNAVKGKPLKLSIKNDGLENVSYVIINYNSRK